MGKKAGLKVAGKAINRDAGQDRKKVVFCGMLSSLPFAEVLREASGHVK